ncbi:hypothetical protein Tco_0121340 [Tanacetum coccineum]
MAPKRTSISAAPAMTQAAIRKLVADSVAAALEAQAATMANADNTNRNTRQGETLVVKEHVATEEVLSLPTFNFKEEALFWWNPFAYPIGIEEAYKIIWSEFKKLLIKKYCPRTEELEILCPTMMPNSEKLMEVFIGGLPRSIEGNVTASKPQNLEEAITITQRLMDQVTKHNSVQGTNDHKRKFDDRRTFTNNNNQNNHNNNSNRNNDHQQQQNKDKILSLSNLQQGGSSDQELQKQRASHWKQPVASVSNLSCLWREKTLQKSVLKSKQQCPWKSILADGQERSQRPERVHEYFF